MNPVRQRGGMLSLLLTMLAIGAVAWFALRGGGVARGTAGVDAEGPATAGAAISCERQVSALIASTGGQGAAYATGYAALPSTCQGLLPAPETLAPRPLPPEI